MYTPARFRGAAAGVAVLASAALIAAGCGSDDSSDTSSDKDMKSSSTMTDTKKSDDTMTASSVISSPGTDLRVTLGRLLGEHAALATVALQETVAGEKDAPAVVAALASNTDDLTAAIASVYGDDAGKAFKTQWEAHIGFFVNYATAVAKKDAAGKAKAAKDLSGYTTSFAKFLHDAAGLDAAAATGALGEHVKQIETAVDQFAAGNAAGGYKQEAMAYYHMFGTADALAAAISKQKPDEFGAGDVSSATADTRQLLDSQLAAHAFFASVALTKTMNGAKDAPEAVKILDANSVDLSKTIGSVYGDAAAKAFLTQWRAHIGFFVNYATAVVKKDDAGQAKGKSDLEGYGKAFGKFLGDATGGDASAYEGALDEHVKQLIDVIDKTGSGDSDGAWTGVRVSYAHMFGTGDAILTAIVKQNPDKFGGSASDSSSGDAMSDTTGDTMTQ